MSRLTRVRHGKARAIVTPLLSHTEQPMCVHAEDGVAIVVADPSGSGEKYLLHLSPTEARVISAALPRLLAQKKPAPGTRAAICNSSDPEHPCPACDA